MKHCRWRFIDCLHVAPLMLDLNCSRQTPPHTHTHGESLIMIIELNSHLHCLCFIRITQAQSCSTPILCAVWMDLKFQFWAATVPVQLLKNTEVGCWGDQKSLHRACDCALHVKQVPFDCDAHTHTHTHTHTVHWLSKIIARDSDASQSAVPRLRYTPHNKPHPACFLSHKIFNGKGMQIACFSLSFLF